MTINDQISAIIKKRHQHLPSVEDRITRWRCFDDAIAKLEAVLAAVDRRSQQTAGAIDGLNRIREFDIRNRIAARIRAWEQVRARLGRQTVNIGVSGQMKVGKSTLLKAISGLADEQIPTSMDECTAVHSRIYHDQSSTAIITFHSWSSFREIVLTPLYAKLLQRPPPETIREFELDTPHHPVVEADEQSDFDYAWKNLEKIRTAVPSYRELLDTGTRPIPLDQIRKYVAFPDPLQTNPPRRYLAVHDCELRNPFPSNSVAALGLIDLPGLGSNIHDIDRYVLEGVQNDTDVVIMVKRATEGPGSKPWNREDRNALKQLEVASRAIGIMNPGDFTLLLINGSDSARIATDRRIIEEWVNETHHYQILDADARTGPQVAQKVLNPVLEHLASRLESMDQNVWTHVMGHDRKEADSLRSSLDEIIRTIQSTVTAQGSDNLVNYVAEKMLGDLATRLNEIEDRYSTRKAGETEWQKRFTAELEKLSNDLESNWLKLYFSTEWIERTAREIEKNKRYVPAVSAEKMNACRAELRHEFSRLDEIFGPEVEKMWDDLALALRATTGSLLQPDRNGKQTILEFMDKCEKGQRACPKLIRACKAVLEANISLRLNFMQCVARGMQYLNPARVGQSQAKEETQSRNGLQLAKDLKEDLSARCSLAIEKTAEEIRKDARLVDEILYAIVEHGNDLFIRSRSILEEYQELVGYYRNEIAPSQFEQAVAKDETCRKCGEAIKAVRSALASLGDQ